MRTRGHRWLDLPLAQDRPETAAQVTDMTVFSGSAPRPFDIHALAERAVTLYWQDKREIPLSAEEYTVFRKLSAHPAWPQMWDNALWQAVQHLGTSMPKWGSKMGVRCVRSNGQEGVVSE